MDRQKKLLPTVPSQCDDGGEGSQQGSSGGSGEGRAGSGIHDNGSRGNNKTVTPLDIVIAENQELNARLRDALGQLRKKEKMLALVWRIYPDLEPKVQDWMEQLKMEKALKRTRFQLHHSINIEEVQEKQDQLDKLTRKVEQEQLKKADVEPSRNGAWRIMNDMRKDAKKILPEEMWSMVLAQVADPKDLWNCSNTCGMFKRILNKDFKKPTWEFMQAFPLLVQYLPRNVILKCRSVSKGWNMVVDNYLEGQLRPQKPKKDVDAVFDYRLLPFANVMKEKKLDLLYKFKFRRRPFDINNPGFPYRPGRNPFIGKSVIIDLAYGVDSGRNFGWSKRDEASWDNLYSFLETFGKYIWYLTLESSVYVGPDHARDQFKRKVQRLLNVDLSNLLPNIRKLRILPNQYEDYDDIDRLLRLRPNELSIAPTLETVEADGARVKGSHLPLVTFLVRQRRTLQVLHLTGDIWRSVYEREWPKLTELHLDHLVNKNDLELLAAGAEKGMPLLKKLGVNLGGAPGSFDWLLDAIHALFGATRLTTLRLHDHGGMFQKTRWISCMSPTLKTLEVEHVMHPEYYGFLRHFPLVENVHVFGEEAVEADRWLQLWDPDDRRHYLEVNGLEVDFHELIWQGKVYQSKIWELLPRLKLFTYRWDVYTRAGYDQVQ